MARYPRTLDPTRDSVPRRAAEVVLSASVGSLFALALAPPGSRTTLVLALSIVAAALAIGVIVIDEVRLWRFDSRAWTTDQWNLLRESAYEHREGLFLRHTLKLTDPPQYADDDDGGVWWKLEVWVTQHREGPLSEGHVREVEYAFGPKFTEGPITMQNPADGFRWTTSIHGSVLVLARIRFKNPLKRPLLLDTYAYVPPVAGR